MSSATQKASCRAAAEEALGAMEEVVRGVSAVKEVEERWRRWRWRMS
jgi:hypothetical protein